jgi:hypothetical protein
MSAPPPADPNTRLTPDGARRLSNELQAMRRARRAMLALAVVVVSVLAAVIALLSLAARR